MSKLDDLMQEPKRIRLLFDVPLITDQRISQAAVLVVDGKPVAFWTQTYRRVPLCSRYGVGVREAERDRRRHG